MTMKTLTSTATIAAVLLAGYCGGLSRALAAPVTFFGEDLNTSGQNRLNPPYVNSDIASAQFQSHLQGTGTETFELIALGTSDPDIAFPGAGTAHISGGGQVQDGVSGTNQYAAFGDRYYFTSNTALNVAFDAPIAAFGFYAVDTGEENDPIALTLTSLGGVTSTLNVPQTTFAPSGSVIFFGFYDTGTQYTNISFANTSGGGDFFAFDNFTVGSVGQIVVNPVPLPPALPLFGAAIVAVGAFGYGLQRRAATRS